MSAHSVEEIKKETRTYVLVLMSLAFLTFVTVAISYLDLSAGPAIAVALLIATVKGSLVACFFMHLISERKLVYSVLIVTVIFFIVLMAAPTSAYFGGTGS